MDRNKLSEKDKKLWDKCLKKARKDLDFLFKDEGGEKND